MKRLTLSIGLCLVLVLATTGVRAQVYVDNPAAVPLALGAVGAATGFAVTGNAAGAALGVGVGIAATAPPVVLAQGYGPPPDAPPPPPPRRQWVPGHYDRYGAWVPGHYRHLRWMPPHYNRYGAWVPGHWK